MHCCLKFEPQYLVAMKTFELKIVKGKTLKTKKNDWSTQIVIA
jgi:hypothetical protein